MRRNLKAALLLASGAAAGAVFLAAAATPALAQKTVEEVTVEGRIPRRAPAPLTYTVVHADLDLTSAAGSTELNRRIRTAADYVCEQANAGLDIYPCAIQAALAVKPQIEAAKRNQPSPF